MGYRWDDGSLCGEDPYAAARRLQADHHPAWVIWWGPKNRLFFAMTRRGDPLQAVNAPTPDELVEKMRWIAAAQRR
jgi:hypothetical protein